MDASRRLLAEIREEMPGDGPGAGPADGPPGYSGDWRNEKKEMSALPSRGLRLRTTRCRLVSWRSLAYVGGGRLPARSKTCSVFIAKCAKPPQLGGSAPSGGARPGGRSQNVPACFAENTAYRRLHGECPSPDNCQSRPGISVPAGMRTARLPVQRGMPGNVSGQGEVGCVVTRTQPIRPHSLAIRKIRTSFSCLAGLATYLAAQPSPQLPDRPPAVPAPFPEHLGRRCRPL